MLWFTTMANIKRAFSGSRWGFTLTEVVAVIVILGLLAAIVTPQIVKMIAKGRDSRRIADINMIADALRAYYLDNGQFPNNTDNDHGGWDCTHDGVFISPLVSGGYLSKTPVDPLNKTASGVSSHTSPNGSYFYSYYRYPAGAYGMPSDRGAYVIVGARSFEVLSPRAFTTTDISGVTRNWGNEFDYYLILFEK